MGASGQLGGIALESAKDLLREKRLLVESKPCLCNQYVDNTQPTNIGQCWQSHVLFNSL